jgi:chromosome segregation ATPase
MAKKRKAAVEDVAASAGRVAGTGPGRQLARLEKRLAGLEKRETKRSRQLDDIRARQAEIRAQIAELGAGAGAAAETTPEAAAAPQAYCMREKRKVTIAAAELVVLSNGRRAYAGSCPDCGARVIAIVGAGRTG